MFYVSFSFYLFIMVSINQLFIYKKGEFCVKSSAKFYISFN